MASHEHSGERHPEQGRGNRIAVAAGLASVAIVTTILAYTLSTDRYDNTDKLPARHAPEKSAYSLLIDPTYAKKVAELEIAASDPELRAQLEALATQPMAEWLLDDAASTYQLLDEVLAVSKTENTIPILVAYDIPDRDLGSHSAGGAASAEQYRQWIDTISKHIADDPSVIILEPDAVPQLPEMNESAANQRKELLAYALDSLQNNTNTAVYLDAGNTTWQSPDTIAELLRAIADNTSSGIPGISLNVANFRSEEETRQYALDIQEAYGQKLYVMIDTSRSGAVESVPENEWCNPDGQRLGSADPIYDPSTAVETAYIKIPGESDGQCGISDKKAGEFDADLLLHQLGH